MKKEFGVNVFGYINGEFGLGEAVRLLIKAMQSVDIPVAVIDYDVATHHRHEDTTFQNFSSEAPYLFNLVLLGPTEARKVLTHYEDATFFLDKFTIYFLNWESEFFPDEYVKNINFYDQVWVPASYCKEIISQYVNCPVELVHYPIEIPIDSEIDPEVEEFYTANTFNFLFMFDYNSSLERKNTLNLIRAFGKAFGKNDTTVNLTIKTSRSTNYPKEKQLLENEIQGFQNIKIVEKIYQKDTLHKIISRCDSYVSLHRSEGFGLTMAEAMFFSKPVIATGYSGNLEFMNADNSFLVDYSMTKVDSDVFNYGRNTIWSNPNIDHAAELLRLVRDNSSEVQEIAKKGNQTIREEYNTIEVGKSIKKKLENLYSNYTPNPIKNQLISAYIENDIMKDELYIVRKSKPIQFIMSIKRYFRNRKKKK